MGIGVFGCIKLSYINNSDIMKLPRTALVPGTPSEFSKTDFWEDFFKLRKSSFEWYGTYTEIRDIIQRYVKPTDRVLVAGCGNSKMSEEMYDEGFRNITNIDNSQIVIDQMNARKGDRDMMHYYNMDASKMEFYEDAFTVVIDKGTLDAVMSDKSCTETPEKMFSEYFRVLKNGGRYICITLCQDFIVEKILQYFPNNGWLVRVHKLGVFNGSLPVFSFVMTKFPKLPQKILEIAADGSSATRRVENESQIKEFIRSQQEYAMVLKDIRKKVDPDQSRPPIELFSSSSDQGTSEFPRFVMYVVDRAMARAQRPYAVFIIPKGKETLRAFMNHEARKKVAAQTPYQRVLFVVLHGKHEYGSQAEIQEELNSVVMDFAPPGVEESGQVPYLSLSAEDIETREIRLEGHSAISGPYAVEDFRNNLEPDAWYRQLVIKGEERYVLSEVRLKKGGPKLKRAKCDMAPDNSYLLPGHERPIVAGLFLKYDPDDKFRVLVLGVAGGAMSAFILHHFKNCHVTGIELDPDLVELARTWFGLSRGETRCQVITDDAIKYVTQLCEKVKTTGDDQDLKYDIIIADFGMNTVSGLACPIPQALEIKYLESLQGVMKPEGLLMINLLCFTEEIRARAMYNVRRIFKVVAKTKCRDFHNEILYCFPEKPTFAKRQPQKNGNKRNKKRKSKKSEDDNSVLHCDKIDLGRPNGDHDIKGNDKTSDGHNDLDAMTNADLPIPKAKLPIRLDKYDSDWAMVWKERVSGWNRISDDVDFREFVSSATVEREVDYYK